MDGDATSARFAGATWRAWLVTLTLPDSTVSTISPMRSSEVSTTTSPARGVIPERGVPGSTAGQDARRSDSRLHQGAHRRPEYRGISGRRRDPPPPPVILRHRRRDRIRPVPARQYSVAQIDHHWKRMFKTMHREWAFTGFKDAHHPVSGVPTSRDVDGEAGVVVDVSLSAEVVLPVEDHDIPVTHRLSWIAAPIPPKPAPTIATPNLCGLTTLSADYSCGATLVVWRSGFREPFRAEATSKRPSELSRCPRCVLGCRCRRGCRPWHRPRPTLCHPWRRLSSHRWPSRPQS